VFLGRGQGLIWIRGFGLLAALAAGCVKQLPPAATPQPVVPAVATTTPPVEGQGRLVVDVVDGPTQVQQVTMQAHPIDRGQGRVTYGFSEEPSPLCATSPCVADVPVGNLLLGFPVAGNRGGMETELVYVGAEPGVYRRALSYYHHKPVGFLYVFGVVATSVGGAAAMTGVALLPAGLSKHNDGLTTAGGITLGAGAALVALGIWALRHEADLYRPGSSIHFPLAGAGPGAP